MKLGDLSENVMYGLNRSAIPYDGKNGYIRITDIDENHSFTPTPITSPDGDLDDKYCLTVGDLIVARTGATTGKSYLYKKNDGKLYFAGFLIKLSIVDAHPLFVYFNTFTDKYARWVSIMSMRSGQPGINAEEYKSFLLYVPEMNEQQKIANFLSSVDKKIQQFTEKQSLLQQYKKGIMQKLFSQEIRFKDEQGNSFPDWEEKKFEGLFQRVTNKNKENNSNVLTISAQRGLINQEKYFNKSVSAKDVTGYYLIEKGSFAYNKSYSKGYPMGAIKRLNNYEKGVVSTLYICFKAINGVSDEFYEQYFEAGLLNREIHKIAQEGARNHGLLNVSVTEFFRDMKIDNPCLAEQNKIASFLGELDKKIDFAKQQIEQTKTFKKGLLQQMFV